MLDITTRIDLEDVVKGFDTIKRQARNLKPVWQVLEPVMRTDIRTNFTRRVASDGTRWPELKESTNENRNRKSRGKRKPRKAKSGMLGKLRVQFAIDFNAQVIRAESRVEWSGVHQDGGTVGHGAEIPAREHMWVSNDFLKITEDRIGAHLLRKF